MFGQPPLLNGEWLQSLYVVNMKFDGIIGEGTGQIDASGNEIIKPAILTDCILDIYITDPNNNNALVVKWSSGGIDPVITLVDEATYPDPNYSVLVMNAVLNELFTARAYTYQWILTDATDNPALLMAGQNKFFIPTGC